jgi:hypothetical protein
MVAAIIEHGDYTLSQLVTRLVSRQRCVGGGNPLLAAVPSQLMDIWESLLDTRKYITTLPLYHGCRKR